MKRLALLILLSLCLVSGVVAKDAQSTEDPRIEQRFKNLTQQLRCPVCQNETLADSNAELAKQMRDQIREQMKAGKTDKEIIAFLTERYGQFILYRPQVTPTTYLLWFGPFLLLAAGLVILFRYIQQRRNTIVDAPLTSEERKRAAELLAVEPGRENI